MKAFRVVAISYLFLSLIFITDKVFIAASPVKFSFCTFLFILSRDTHESSVLYLTFNFGWFPAFLFHE